MYLRKRITSKVILHQITNIEIERHTPVTIGNIDAKDNEIMKVDHDKTNDDTMTKLLISTSKLIEMQEDDFFVKLL